MNRWNCRSSVRATANMKLIVCLFAFVASAMAQSNYDPLEATNNQFTARMFQEVIKLNPGRNIVLSAFSVLTPLAQLTLASVGEPHDELLRAIGFPHDFAVKEAFTHLSRQLNSVRGVELRMANKIYVRRGDVLNEQFAVVSRNVFNSDIQNIDFSRSAEAAQQINRWVEDNTNRRIKDLVPSYMLDGSTTAVLVNAILFKGKWQKPFEKLFTQDRDFYVSRNKIIQIPTMESIGLYKYGESRRLDAKIIELLYDDWKSSLIVVLPNQIDGLYSLLEKLRDPLALSREAVNMSNRNVFVRLPKFRIETTTNLKEVLTRMNIRKTFSPGQARLENLLRRRSDLSISDAIQKVYIDVDEDGTEAAASNAFMISASMSPGTADSQEFIADRPFYFALKVVNKTVFNGIFVQ